MYVLLCDFLSLSVALTGNLLMFFFFDFARSLQLEARVLQKPTIVYGGDGRVEMKESVGYRPFITTGV